MSKINSKKLLLECYYPSSCFYKILSSDNNQIINDFLIASDDKIVNTNIVGNLNQCEYKIRFSIDNIIEIKLDKMIIDYFIKNKLANDISIRFVNNQIDLNLTLLLFTYCNQQNANNDILDNLQSYVYDITTCYSKNKVNINSILSNLGSIDFYTRLVSNCFFIKLDQNIDIFLDYFFIKNPFSKIDIVLFKLLNISIANQLNIYISGTKDPLDIKKEIEYLIKHINDNIQTINLFFKKYKIEDNCNILFVRITNLISPNILALYKYFNIHLSIIDKINVYYNLCKIDVELKILRIFKLIKNIKSSKGLTELDHEDLVTLQEMNNADIQQILQFLILCIDKYKINDLTINVLDDFINLFIFSIKKLLLI